MNPLPRFYAIADASFGNPVDIARDLFAGGVRLLQIRSKTATANELLRQVERILAIAPADSFVIVNDRTDVARISGAAGVHLGQTDLPADAARDILGPKRMVGISTHNLRQALDADRLPVDYIAVGPVFPTSTKANPDPVVGLDGLREIRRAVRKPVVAIGGITLQNAAAVLQAGVDSIAVVSGLLACSDIRLRAKEWIEMIGRNEG
ncbi:MAG: thiamine phosphate synthase [Acidobacteria bacterium]|nr:thiamine phosphate synthase [Acidobacteriota bacterium]